MEEDFCGLPAWGKAFSGEELLLLLGLEVFFVDQDPVAQMLWKHETRHTL